MNDFGILVAALLEQGRAQLLQERNGAAKVAALEAAMQLALECTHRVLEQYGIANDTAPKPPDTTKEKI